MRERERGGERERKRERETERQTERQTERKERRREQQLLSNLAFVSRHTFVNAPSGGVGRAGKKKKERKCGCSILLHHVYCAPSARFSHAKCNLLDQGIIHILSFKRGKNFLFEIPTRLLFFLLSN